MTAPFKRRQLWAAGIPLVRAQDDYMNDKLQIDLLIFGAGGHAKVASDCAGPRYPRRIMLSGDGRGGTWRGVPVVPQEAKPLADWKTLCRRAFVAIGGAARREAVLASLEAEGFDLVTLVHPSAAVSPSARLGPGTLICPKAVVNADARIGRGCIVNTGAIVEHDCEIGEFSHISPGAVLGGGVVLGERCWVCVGAVVSDHVQIGSSSTIGAGAAVLAPVPGGVLAAGVPARVVKRY